VSDEIQKKIEREEYEPKLNVLFSLGYMLAKPEVSPSVHSSHEKLRSYISDGTGRSFWKGKVRWCGKEKYMDKTYRNQVLSHNAEVAMGLSAGKGAGASVAMAHNEPTSVASAKKISHK
jgi:hypothetical protein